jgi:GH24 family phage-related lysozyme (muramidase)
MMHVSPRGRALIKQFEGFREIAYQDVVGVWTVGLWLHARRARPAST